MNKAVRPPELSATPALAAVTPPEKLLRVKVQVLKNMTYLEGRFYQEGSRVTISRSYAEAAVADGSARHV